MTKQTKGRIRQVKSQLVGSTVSRDPIKRARQIENHIGNQGWDLNNKEGADLKDYGIEIKSRDLDAVSPHTVGSMTIEDIIATAYEQSNVFNKIQQQHRIKIQNGKVVDEYTYDFRADYIQDKIRDCYEAARAKIISGDRSKYIYGGEYGYFEQSTTSENSYNYRMSDSAMTRIENMARSTYGNLFEEK